MPSLKQLSKLSAAVALLGSFIFIVIHTIAHVDSISLDGFFLLMFFVTFIFVMSMMFGISFVNYLVIRIFYKENTTHYMLLLVYCVISGGLWGLLAHQLLWYKADAYVFIISGLTTGLVGYYLYYKKAWLFLKEDQK